MLGASGRARPSASRSSRSVGQRPLGSFALTCPDDSLDKPTIGPSLPGLWLKHLEDDPELSDR